MKTSFIVSTAFVAVAAAVDVLDNNKENETQDKIKYTSSQSQQPHHRHGRRSLAKASKIAKSGKVPKTRKSNKSMQVETSMPSISSLPSSQPSSTPSNQPSTQGPTPKWTPPPVSETPSTQPSSQPSTEPSSQPSNEPSTQGPTPKWIPPTVEPTTIIPTKWTPTTIPTMEPQIVATKRSGHVTWFRWGVNRALRWWNGIEVDDNNEKIAYDEKKYGHRLLEGTSNYDPTLNEVIQIAKEGNGNLDSTYIIKKNLLTSEECALLVAYTDENEGSPVGMNTSDNDHVIKKFPLEDIIGVQRTEELYNFFKEYTNGSSIDQIALRRLTGKSGLSMKLHTDVQPYQLKIALNSNEDFEGGDYVVGDRTGAKRIHLETGSGLLHDSGLVHGHLPHFGQKYILYLISDTSLKTQM